MEIEKRTVAVPDGTIADCGYIENAQEEFCIILDNLQLLSGNYVLSFWIKSSSTGIVSVEGFTSDVGNEWKRCIFDIKVKSSGIILEFQPGEYWIYNAKLEMGNKVTDWMPSPEDVNELVNVAQKTADGKNTAYYQDCEPSGGAYRENDLWFDEGNGYKMYHYLNGEWKSTEFGTDALAAESVTAGKIAACAVTAGKIAAGAVTTDKLYAFSVTADKIASGAVEADKIAANAITANKIASGAVETATLASNAVTADKIAANAITATHISSQSITGDKIAAGEITATHIDVTDLVANGFVKTNKLTAANINVNDLLAQNIVAAGTIQSSNYNYSSGDYSNSGMELDMSTGRIRSRNFSIDLSGNLCLRGEIEAKAGKIGGWEINTESLSYGDTRSDNFMKLDPYNKSIISKTKGAEESFARKAVFASGRIAFYKDEDAYCRIGVNEYLINNVRTGKYGFGVNSEFDSSYTAFGHKKRDSENEPFTTSLLLNYGLNPEDMMEEVIVYGTSRFCSDMRITGKLLFGSGSAGLWYTSDQNIYTTGILGVNGVPNNNFALMVNGSSAISGNLGVGGYGYTGYALGVDGNSYFNGDIYCNAQESGAATHMIVQNGTHSGAMAVNGNCFGLWDFTYNKWMIYVKENGSVVTASTLSDSRLKSGIKNTAVNNALQQILNIRHREFTFDFNNEYKDIGYVAQELEKINKKMVIPPDSEVDYYHIDSFYLQAIITKAIQEFYREYRQAIAELKARI